ncbi:MAG: hypothetical protein IIZ34_05960 [Eubacterium sp.]|nr:hypothetical protein [Eubacterium sp.]
MTADYVFSAAMHLHDDGDEATGQHDTVDNREYKNRLLPLINLRISEIYPYSDTKSSTSGKRPTHPKLTSINDEIDLDDYCLDVLTWGVAAAMYSVEDTNSASYYQQEYERLLSDLKNGRPGMPADTSEDIVDVYGGGYYDANGDWHYYNGNGIGFEWVARW